MRITHEYAQNIVEKTIKLLGRNINIMDDLAIIVGSGERNRINTYHQGAAKAIATGKPIKITSEQASDLEGVKPGINLPIFLNKEIVGVVGITGEPEEVCSYGELLKICVEAMFNQFYLSEQLRIEQNAKDLYVHDILNGNIDENSSMFLSKGTVLGYDMSLPRIALVIRIYDFIEAQTTNIEIEPGKNTEFFAQKRREKILVCIKSVFNDKEHMISYTDSKNYVILYAIKKMETFKKQIKELIKIFHNKIEKYSVHYRIGVGCYYNGLLGLRKSYKDAVKVIQIREKILNQPQAPEIIFASDMGLELILANTPEEMLRMYKDQILTDITAKSFFNEVKLIKTLKTFFKFNMNVAKTAECLQITRNTVSGRLDKVKKLTSLDPKNFNDAVKLKLLLTINDIIK